MVAATIFLVGVLGLLYAFWLREEILRERIEDRAMLELSLMIREGAYAFLRKEALHVGFVVLILFFLLGLVTDFATRASFLLGAGLSLLAGLAGLDAATLANARTAQHAARQNRGAALNTAFNGGSVMGLAVASLALVGVSIVLFLLPPLHACKVLLGFGMGGSLVALFARLGGGIFTKAADVGADLAGKLDEEIPEDDRRNPGVIADNVGDNVGDVAGMGADLFESFAGSMVACGSLAALMPLVEESSRVDLAQAPFVMGALGLLGSLVGIHKMGTVRDLEPAAALRSCQLVASVVFFILLAVYTLVSDFACAHWLASLFGGLCGALVARIAEYFTGAKPVQEIVEASQSGAATNVIHGLAYGLMSVGPVLLTLAFTVLVANWCDGLYGISVAAVSMLATVGITMAVDAYGPIADNAGGLVEMSQYGAEARAVTDELDALGNTTAALGKGFSIGSAALTSLSLFGAFTYAVPAVPNAAGVMTDSVMNPLFLVGALIGAMMPCVVSGMTILSVGRAAGTIVDEIRRQFREIPGLREGRDGVLPESTKCIELAADAALREMKLPTLLAVTCPVVVALVGGRDGVLGLLVGATTVSIVLALSMVNSGGAWDNAKKRIEQGLVPGVEKGGVAHKAAVVGDTVGDPLKDTSGPALNILMKLTALISLLLGPLLVG